jgi:acylphosphatase
VFSGPAAVVADMLKRCEQGPADARVAKVTITKEGGSVPRGFNLLATDRWR